MISVRSKVEPKTSTVVGVAETRKYLRDEYYNKLIGRIDMKGGLFYRLRSLYSYPWWIISDTIKWRLKNESNS